MGAKLISIESQGEVLFNADDSKLPANVLNDSGAYNDPYSSSRDNMAVSNGAVELPKMELFDFRKQNPSEPAPLSDRNKLSDYFEPKDPRRDADDCPDCP